MAEPTIRYGRLEDIPQILDFVRAGAEDQAPGTKPAATIESLTKTLHLEGPSSSAAHSPTPKFAWTLLIFAPDGKPAGQLVYFFNYSTWAGSPGICLEELYVAPDYRGHGYAKLLIKKLAAIAKEAGCTKMEWLCLVDNARALRFYEKLGARKANEWMTLRLDSNGIKELAEGSKKV